MYHRERSHNESLGERTPFPRDGEWPVTADQYPEEDVSEDEVDRRVRSAPILHSNGDALDIAAKDGRIVGVRGRTVDRVNKGRLDPKDLYGWQANNSEDRLTTPLVGQDGKLVEAAWSCSPPLAGSSTTPPGSPCPCGRPGRASRPVKNGTSRC